MLVEQMCGEIEALTERGAALVLGFVSLKQFLQGVLLLRVAVGGRRDRLRQFIELRLKAHRARTPYFWLCVACLGPDARGLGPLDFYNL